MVRSPPTLKMNPSGWQTYQSIFPPPLSRALCPSSALSQSLVLWLLSITMSPSSLFILTHTDTVSVRGAGEGHKEGLSHPLASSITPFLFFHAPSLFPSQWLSLFLRLHSLSFLWKSFCISLLFLTRLSWRTATWTIQNSVCVCVRAGASLFWYSKSVRAKCAIAVRANRHTLLKVSQEYTQKASMPAHTQTHTQAMGFLGLQCKSAQRAPTSSWKAASYKGEAYTQSFSWRQQTRLSRVSEGKCHTRG